MTREREREGAATTDLGNNGFERDSPRRVAAVEIARFSGGRSGRRPRLNFTNLINRDNKRYRRNQAEPFATEERGGSNKRRNPRPESRNGGVSSDFNTTDSSLIHIHTYTNRFSVVKQSTIAHREGEDRMSLGPQIETPLTPTT